MEEKAQNDSKCAKKGRFFMQHPLVLVGEIRNLFQMLLELLFRCIGSCVIQNMEKFT